MRSRRDLERLLQECRGFEEPRAELEQYQTPAGLAAHLVHVADLRGDLADRTVLDLGAGTGILALGAATRSSNRVLGIERDRPALDIARENERTLRRRTDLEPVAWIRGDATRLPFRCPDPVTVLSNPPFGAQRGHRHADRGFLEAIAALAPATSYTIHNAGSHGFVEAFAGDNGGLITDAWAADLDLDRQFPFHEDRRRSIDVEIARIEWSG